MRRVFLLISLSSLLVPASAGAAVRIVVRGAGFGHGIGLSQYGAYGYAQHGFTYRDILGHYYRGTSLDRAGQRTVRVILQSGDRYVRFRGATRISSKDAKPNATYVVRPKGGDVSVTTSGGDRVGDFAAPLKVSSSRGAIRLLGPAMNGLSNGLYRGSLVVSSGGGRVSAVNALSLDDYVQGVVPGEMPSSWAPEALKAQSVVARSYALATIKPGALFDLYPDTRSQVYKGASGEAPSSNSAVRATAGQVLTYGGRVAITYYFSTSGGQTENVENVFFSTLPRPWLRGVDDPFDTISPRHRWLLAFTPAQLGKRLGAPGSFRKVVVERRGVSPRIVRARVVGSRGSRVLTGPQIRSRLGLYDSWAYFTRASATQAHSVAERLSFFLLRVRPMSLAGTFTPAPRRRRLVVERRGHHRWRRVGRARTDRRGRYLVHVRRRGPYRVRAGSVAAPPVRVR